MRGIEWRIVADSLDSEGIHHALEEKSIDKEWPGHKTSFILEAPSFDNAPTLSADDLARLRRRLIKLLNAVEGVSGQKQGVASRIKRLVQTGYIPRETAAFMLAVSEARNVTEYQAKRLSPTEAEAVKNAWKAVVEWAHSQGIAIE